MEGSSPAYSSTTSRVVSDSTHATMAASGVPPNSLWNSMYR